MSWPCGTTWKPFLVYSPLISLLIILMISGNVGAVKCPFLFLYMAMRAFFNFFLYFSA